MYMSFLRDEEIQRLCSALCKIPMEELPRIHYEIDCGRWPEVLGDLPSEMSPDAMAWIDARCGKKAILRWRKVEKEGYTNEMFEDWYDSNFVGSHEYKPLLHGIAHKIDGMYDTYEQKILWFPLTISIIALLISVVKWFI